MPEPCKKAEQIDVQFKWRLLGAGAKNIVSGVGPDSLKGEIGGVGKILPIVPHIIRLF